MGTRLGDFICNSFCFSILVRIDLFDGVVDAGASALATGRFSILVRIDLFDGEYCRRPQVGQQQVSVSSCGSTCLMGDTLNFGVKIAAVSVSSCGSTCLMGTDGVIMWWTRETVSVSSCGSTCLMGPISGKSPKRDRRFQYPRADRLV